MPLNFEPWPKSECISHAVGWQQLAFYWGTRINDVQYQDRYRMTNASVERQIDLAASEAIRWYNRARRAKK